MNFSKIADLLAVIWHCLYKAFRLDDNAKLARDDARLTEKRLTRIRVMKEALPTRPVAKLKLAILDDGLSLPPELVGCIDLENPNFCSTDNNVNLSRISQYRLAAYVATLTLEERYEIIYPRNDDAQCA
ncbi:MAG: hypothetical protein KGS72_27710 [Cyanobacteria bacterium REEB67]|nr:hypothetical protein [Cyanobacteria bacterium REEB67]